jgi:hypothetical protein
MLQPWQESATALIRQRRQMCRPQDTAETRRMTFASNAAYPAGIDVKCL